jgi:hypothetical protein
VFISPAPRVAPEVFRLAVDVLAAHGAPSFKVGTGLHGLLRPDKMVAYFAHLPDMLECARTLAVALRGFPAHGVPFSAVVDDDGLVSWGLDPWNQPNPVAGQRRESWRESLTFRLARAMIIARHSPSEGVTPEAFALARIALDGVDPVTWEPRDTLANRDGAAA